MTGNTPLMLAVKDNKTPLIDRLVDLGSDVCARNNVSCKIFSNIIVQFLQMRWIDEIFMIVKKSIISHDDSKSFMASFVAQPKSF